MRISARVDNGRDIHVVSVTTNDNTRELPIPAKPGGQGVGVNGGELLCLALATCCCNDVYREAKKRGIGVTNVEVEADAEFGAEGEPAERLTYRVRIAADAPAESVEDLMRHVDRVTEIQNTVRKGSSVELTGIVVPSRRNS